MEEVMVLVRRAATVELIPSRTTRRALAVVLFAALTALGAFVAVPLPGNPVPITLETLFVLLAGALLGPELGAASQVVYLLAGVAGLPVFAEGLNAIALAGPTGGYLLAFPLAAWVVGRLAGPGSRRTSALRLGLALIAGTAVVYAVGTAQLSLFVGGLGDAAVLGVLPFLAGDTVKTLLALLIAWRLRTRTLEQV